MAIKGDFIFKKYIETGTEEVTTIVPEDIPETDPRYDDRGKEITFQKPIYCHFDWNTVQKYDHCVDVYSTLILVFCL